MPLHQDETRSYIYFQFLYYEWEVVVHCVYRASVRAMVFNAIFNNISFKSWWQVLLVDWMKGDTTGKKVF